MREVRRRPMFVCMNPDKDIRMQHGVSIDRPADTCCVFQDTPQLFTWNAKPEFEIQFTKR